MTICLFSAGFHSSAIIVNPQDLAPKHSGSVFGIMNAAGAMPGKKFYFYHEYFLTHDYILVFFTGFSL